MCMFALRLFLQVVKVKSCFSMSRLPSLTRNFANFRTKPFHLHTPIHTYRRAHALTHTHTHPRTQEQTQAPVKRRRSDCMLASDKYSLSLYHSPLSVKFKFSFHRQLIKQQLYLPLSSHVVFVVALWRGLLCFLVLASTVRSNWSCTRLYLI